MKIFSTFYSTLKAFFKPSKSKPDVEGLERRTKALETFAETTSRVVLSHNTKLDKNAKVHDALLDVLVEHEKDVDSVKKLINQHAQVINTMQKVLYDDPDVNAESSTEESSIKEYISTKYSNDNKDNN